MEIINLPVPKFIFTTLFFIIFWCYVIPVWHKYGVQKSISQTFYKIKHPKIFSIWCWNISVLYLASTLTLFGFLASIGIMLVAFNPFLKIKIHWIFHMIGAIVGITFSQLNIWINCGYWQLTLLAGLLFIWVAIITPKRFWWIEIIAFNNVTLCNYFLIFNVKF